MKAALAWLDDRLGLSTTFKPIIEHPVPPTGWDYTIGSATLTSGATVKCFLCEPWAIAGALDITRYGGWRSYLASSKTQI